MTNEPPRFTRRDRIRHNITRLLYDKPEGMPLDEVYARCGCRWIEARAVIDGNPDWFTVVHSHSGRILIHLTWVNISAIKQDKRRKRKRTRDRQSAKGAA